MKLLIVFAKGSVVLGTSYMYIRGRFKTTVLRAYCNCAATLFRFNILASMEFEVFGILQRFWFDLDTEYPRFRAVLKLKPCMIRAAGTCKISLFKTVVLVNMSAVLDGS